MLTKTLLGICAWLALHVAAAGATTYRVGIGDDCSGSTGQSSCFTPSEITIRVGDSVEFYEYAETFFTGYHNVVADDGSFRCAIGCDDEGGDGTPVSDSICNAAASCVPNPARLSFVRTFSQPGDIRYHDEVSKAAGTIFVRQSLPGFFVTEIYSSADASIQFMLFWPGDLSSLDGRELVSASGSNSNTFVFPTANPNDSLALKPGPALVATQGFANLHLVKPDFIVPNGFFFTGASSVSVRDPPYLQNTSYVYRYGSLPIDGKSALYPSIDYDIGTILFYVAPAVAANHAGDYAALTPLPVHDVVEYYNGALDDYFLTAYDDEIAALDAGRIPGWQRTGYALSTWEGPPTSVIPGLLPVCRVFLGVTHFYSVNGCADAMAIRGAIAEAGDAFYAMLPDPESGSCPRDTVPVYRLWNPRDTGHRYTVRSDVRADMLNRGYISEGYGPVGVAMCVPDAAQPKALLTQ